MKLNEISSIRTGLVLSRKKAQSYDETKRTYKLLTLKAFSSSTYSTYKNLDKFVSREEISEEYISRVGDIIVRLREPINAVYIDKSTEGMLIPSLMCIIRTNDNISINKEFLAYYLNSTEVKKALQSRIKGTTIPMIKTRDIEELDIVLPPVSEQTKIVAFLKLSQSETELLDKLKRQKEHFAKSVLDTIIERSKGEY